MIDIRFCGRGLNQREIAHAHQRHLQRARNRRRGERQHVDGGAHLLEPLLVHHAEALLFVDDDQAEIAKDDVFLQQAVRADDDVDLAVGEVAQASPAVLCLRLEARELVDAHRKAREARAERAVVLRGEQRRRHEHRDLLLCRRSP